MVYKEKMLAIYRQKSRGILVVTGSVSLSRDGYIKVIQRIDLNGGRGVGLVYVFIQNSIVL